MRLDGLRSHVNLLSAAALIVKYDASETHKYEQIKHEEIDTA